MIQTAFNGLCMALADSVPGVSGGTIAFILGFYDSFIEALHNLFGADKEARKKAVTYLLKLGIGWCIGMGGSVLLLSGLFESNIYFMSSFFLGLTAVAVPFILKAERETLSGKTENFSYTVLGAGLVILISLARSCGGEISGIDFQQLQPLQYLYILISGMAAISAMVLPGISGSTVLLIAGVYLPVITAAKQLMHLDLSVVPGLAALGIGILAGAALSIRFIRRALVYHRAQMVYLILGMTAGSAVPIIMGPTTLSVAQPALSLGTFSIPGFLLGIGILLGLEYWKKRLSASDGAGSREVLNDAI